MINFVINFLTSTFTLLTKHWKIQYIFSLILFTLQLNIDNENCVNLSFPLHFHISHLHFPLTHFHSPSIKPNRPNNKIIPLEAMDWNFCSCGNVVLLSLNHCLNLMLEALILHFSFNIVVLGSYKVPYKSWDTTNGTYPHKRYSYLPTII